jgi:hypothetical protein
MATCVSGCGVSSECTQYTHHSLLNMLPQKYTALNGVFLIIMPQKCNFSKAKSKLPEDGPSGPKHVGANVEMF